MTKKLNIIFILFLSLIQYSFADTVLRIGKIDKGVKIYVNGQYIQTGTGKKVDLILKSGNNKIEFKRNISEVSEYYAKLEYVIGNTDSPFRIDELSLEDINFVLVEGGTFTMGDSSGETYDAPAHNVTLDSFYISKYEVTQKDFFSIMNYNPSEFNGNDLPVENINWYTAIEYANRLSEKEGLKPYYNINTTGVTIVGGKGYRLPTEAEWEYAAKGGENSKGYKYSGSNNLEEVAWDQKKSNFKTHVVGQKKANELGIYDMSGNVLEWCWDWKEDYSLLNQKNPVGPIDGNFRVVRNGTTGRVSRSPIYSGTDVGFRLVRTY